MSEEEFYKTNFKRVLILIDYLNKKHKTQAKPQQKKKVKVDNVNSFMNIFGGGKIG